MIEITVYLVPHSSFRGSSLPRSDTLFGAICWAYKLLFGSRRLEELLGRFLEDRPPFLLTSIFSYYEQQGRKIHLLPKPLCEPFSPSFERSRPALDELEALQQLKRLHSVHADEFSDILYGKKNEQTFYEQILNTLRASKGQEQQEEEHGRGLFRALPGSFQTPHSALNRLSDSVDGSHFFYTEEYSPVSGDSDKTGGFFCVKCAEEHEHALKTVFHFLADKGIGGGSSVGKGHLKELSISEGLPYDEPPAKESSHIVTLSLTSPCEKIQKVLEHSHYDLEKRQGKLESMYLALGSNAHIWKDHLLMLKEGSTFPKNGREGYGQNRIVRKNDGKLGFDVQHYGYAFTVNSKHIS